MYMGTIAKRTFFEGCTIELFQRNDGGHRIKFVSPNGDEVTLNLDTKGWAKSTPSQHFEDIAFGCAAPNFTGVGSKLPHNIALWNLLANCDSYITNIVAQLGCSLSNHSVDKCEVVSIGGATSILESAK